MLAIGLTVLSIPLLGCDFLFADWQNTTEEPAPAEAPLAPADIQTGVERAEGNYTLTFTGEPVGPWSGSFDPVNRTPAMLTESAFTARETQMFSSGTDPRTAIQAKDTWVIDATRRGTDISGTAKFVRWRDEQTKAISVNTETGAETVLTDYYEPALTVTWEGELIAVIDTDGTIVGTIDGTFSNSEGFSKPFTWDFTGIPAK